MQDSATAIRHAAAQAREILVNAAASRLGTSADRLIVRNGVVTTEDGRSLRYGELVTNELLHVQAQPQSKLKDPGTFAVIGQPIQRVDIPAKVTGGLAYVQDLRLPGMVHARVVRPPNYGARLRSVGTGQVENMPGVLKVVRDGSFLAVIAEKEYLALRAMDVLALTALWDEANNTLPNPAQLYDWVRSCKFRGPCHLSQPVRTERGHACDRSGLPSAVSDTWIDRSVLCGGALGERDADCLESYARCLSASHVDR
jgi:hypothetical protein